MARSAHQTRRSILEAAYELFYRKGFVRVGVDEIAALANVTKRTLYYHFKSKDELLASVLDLHHELALARIRKYEDRCCGNADDVLGVLFSELAKWTKKTRLDGDRIYPVGHGTRRLARSSRARHRASP